WAYFMRGFLPVLQSDAASARPWLAKAAEVARRTGDLSMLSQTVAMASIAETMLGEFDTAALMLEEANAAAVEIPDDPAPTLSVLQARTLNGFLQGDIEMVRKASTEGIRISREVNDLYALDVMLGELGSATLLGGGDPEKAKLLYAEALRIAREIDDRLMQYYLLDAFAYLAATTNPRHAAQLLGAADVIRLGAGAEVLPFLAPMNEQTEEKAIAALGVSKFEAELNTGKVMGREAAVRLALGESAPVAETNHAGADILGKRETDVARLIAEGLSNKQIGARLFISERTVDSHVRSILNKLGVNSRAQIASWVASLQ
ncbi:MAG TPA: helix-turn-helix transcriptional regulator, partial [Candidatus Dormibacteraeota bacterium]|nr:helix-turn-helix transcriptional regulator [Candidatus Dormibacteraeota bacterium]